MMESLTWQALILALRPELGSKCACSLFVPGGVGVPPFLTIALLRLLSICSLFTASGSHSWGLSGDSPGKNN